MKKNLIAIEKDGETIEVSPLVLEQHKLLGWKVVGAPPEEAAPVEPAAEDKTEGKSRKSRSRKNKAAEKAE